MDLFDKILDGWQPRGITRSATGLPVTLTRVMTFRCAVVVVLIAELQVVQLVSLILIIRRSPVFFPTDAFFRRKNR